MIILVINSGSSSVKFQVFKMETETVLCRGIVEKIGSNFSRLKLKYGKDGSYEESSEILDHRIAISKIISVITDARFSIVPDVAVIGAVGHRVVHGGESFTGSVLISTDVIDAMERCIELAPLHNPPNIRGIKICRELLPDVPQVGVFDTAFHQTMPDYAYLYGLPYSLYEKYKIRRYGFHGTSHYYASREVARIMGRAVEELKIITCHLGNGASIAAVRNGESIDTSMGFTPLEGLVMGTRCGDLDPAIIPFLIEKDQLTLDGINNLMNKHSGVYGLAGMKTGDMRDLELAADSGNKRALLARDIYAYRIRKYIGAYAAALGGVDAVVFTGGVGENDPQMRERSLVGLEFLGLVLDLERNKLKDPGIISKGAVQIIVIKADEELVIAREANRIVQSSE